LGKRPTLFCQGEAQATTGKIERAAPTSRETYDYGHNPLLLVNIAFFGVIIDFLDELSTGEPVATF
jgi:hypothetical protein